MHSKLILALLSALQQKAVLPDKYVVYVFHKIYSVESISAFHAVFVFAALIQLRLIAVFKFLPYAASAQRSVPFLPYLIKFVLQNSSFSGSPNFSLPSAMLLIRNTIFLASVRMVCRPSPSCAASPCAVP